MSDKKKKIFPKLKKKIKWFLTDESGKITKKDALGLAAGAVLLSGVDEVSAGHSSNFSSKGNKDWWGNPSCSYAHASWIVNGHYSRDVSGIVIWHHEGSKTLWTHSSHSSHGSHGSHGSHCNWL